MSGSLIGIESSGSQSIGLAESEIAIRKVKMRVLLFF